MKKRTTDTVYAADMFCGAGGMSSGLLAACKQMGFKLDLIAINHWPVAIDTHSVNHPYAKHLCESADNVDPRKLVPSGRLNLLLAGPECTHHSNARGGKPMSDQSRASAWHVLRWAEAIYIENILIENVKEFQSWGPLGAKGRPIQRLKGQLFLNFLAAFKALGYRVEHRILNAADYGDPTTRERLFIMARRGNRPIIWPRPTHAPIRVETGQQRMFAKDTLKPWRTAREIIDWDIPGRSIFQRKKPLAGKTIERIAAGLRKFGGKNAEPFLLMLYGTGTARSIDRPLPTVTARGTHVGLIEPFLLGQQSGATPRSVDEPVPTVATGGAISLIEPFIVGAGGPERAGKPRSVNEPLNTVLGKNSSALVEPFLLSIDQQSGGNQVRSIDEPVPTVITKARTCIVEPYVMRLNRPGDPSRSVDEPLATVTAQSSDFGLIEPFLVEVAHGNGNEKNGNNRRVQDLDSPMKAVTGSNNQALVEPFIMDVNHGGGEDGRAQPLSEPLKTVTTKRGKGLVEPFIVKYYGTAKTQGVDEPLDTVTTKQRFGLIETEHGTFKLDIRFRMLEPHELAAAQGLKGYKFTGKKTEVVKQIGNAVPKNTAAALCSELLQ